MKQNRPLTARSQPDVESMKLGGLARMTALTMGFGRAEGNGHKEIELKKPIGDKTYAKERLNRTTNRRHWIIRERTSDQPLTGLMRMRQHVGIATYEMVSQTR